MIIFSCYSDHDDDDNDEGDEDDEGGDILSPMPMSLPLPLGASPLLAGPSPPRLCH